MNSINFGKLIIDQIGKTGIDISDIKFNGFVQEYNNILELEDRKVKLWFKINYEYKDELIKNLAYAVERVKFKYGYLKYYSICGHRIKDRQTREFAFGDYYLLFDIVLEDDKLNIEDLTKPEIKEVEGFDKGHLLPGKPDEIIIEKPKKKKNKKKGMEV